jgi:hypothetical protein
MRLRGFDSRTVLSIFDNLVIDGCQWSREHEIAGSNPATPTIVGIKPFGKNVEGLSLYGD